MGRKGRKEFAPTDEDYEPAEAAAVEDEQLHHDEFSGKKKSKGKAKNGAGESASVQDDGEGEVLSEIQPSGKHKQEESRGSGKRKGGKKAKDDDENEATVDKDAEEDEDAVKKKGKNKFELAEADEDGEDLGMLMRFAGKKKGKKKPGSLQLPSVQDEDEVDGPPAKGKAAAIEDDGIPRLTGNKKAKQKPPPADEDQDEGEDLDMLVQFSGRKAGVFEDENEEDKEEESEELIQFTGKKKSKKGKKPQPVVSSILQDENDVEKDEPADELIQFTGKKKSRKDKKSQPSHSDSVLNEEEKVEPADELAQFTGKDKSKKGRPPLDKSEEKDELADEPVLFTGKKKSKKEKRAPSSILLEEGEDVPAEEPMHEISVDSSSTVIQAAEAPSPKEAVSGQKPVEVDELDELARDIEASSTKNKSKKKKKSDKDKGKTDGELDDLDKLLMEIEAPTDKKTKSVKGKVSAPAEDVSQVASQVQGASEESKETGEQVQPDGEEQPESAAAKKKKKKKEKEKAKAAAGATDVPPAGGEAAPKNEEAKPKAGSKPVSKALRELHERLAKQKEQEEQLKREAEERRRKEEEEQARLEQLEREKEEAKKRRKEREKQKREEKKRAGIILTKKEKEEARRLAIMREQILRDRGLDVDAEEGHVTAPKKPKYETKKKRKPEAFANETVEANEAAETQPDEADMMDTNLEEAREEAEELEPEEEVEEEEEEDDWDAKSWDEEVALKPLQKTFADEEEEEAEAPIRPAPTISPKPSFKVHAEDTAKASSPQADSLKAPAEVAKDQQVKTTPPDKEHKAEVSADGAGEEIDLRSPICCILGHVDTGKTKLLDCIRRTKVQEGEAGGITQQIGATYFPRENIREKTKELKADAKLRVPGLLVIDTPGHESFTNLRARGSGLCDIAVLVIDIMHGLEPQTIESLNLLKMRKTPYVIALNKVDRLYGWKTRPNAPINISLKDQSKETKQEFETRVAQVITQLQEQGLNSELYWKNKELAKQLKDKGQRSGTNWSDDDYANIVPTSAITGEGIPDLLLLLVQLTQKMLETRLTFKTELECTVLEVKVVEGLGTTIDVVLVNGVLHEGDQIVVCGMQGPIATTIRALLTPHPMKELRVKGSYQHHKELKAAQGIKITAQGLEHAIAGTQLYVVGPEDDVDEIKNEAMQDVNNVLSRIDKSGEGVCVQASTLGSLEALLEFLKSPAVKIPVSGISIGPVHKKDVMRASVMLEKRKEYAAILAFDVKVNPEARELAEELGVRIFTADIIYHLFDQFTAYMEGVKNEKRSQTEGEAVFPCILKILPGCVFNNKDPIIVGVEVLEGVAKIGTPLCVPKKDFIDLGRIASLEINHKVVDVAKRGEQVAMKIVGNVEESQKSFGRHFELEDELVSHITRRSIDVLKDNFRDEVSKDEWRLVTKLKALFQIQ